MKGIYAHQRDMENPGICQPTPTTASYSLSDSAPTVLQRFFDEYPNTFLEQHHIETYNAFIFREMPDIIHAQNPITILKEEVMAGEGENKKGTGQYKYKVEIFVGDAVPSAADLKIDVGPPIVSLDGGATVRRMFPNEARLRQVTYAASFRADILIRITFHGQEEPFDIKFPEFPLFKIPILLRSNLCATQGASASLLSEMGECRNDQGGYFIIDGAEKVLITRQEQAYNSPYISIKPKHNLKTATEGFVVCQDPITKQTRRVGFARYHENVDQGLEEGVIRVSIPFAKGNIPLFVLFRALGIESDEEIVRMILPDTESPVTKVMELSLIPSIHDAYPIVTTQLAQEFIKTLTKGFQVAHVLDILHNHLFCHVPDAPKARAQYLAEFVRKMIRIEMTLEPATNRDDIRNQRLLPTGTLIRGLFSESWKQWAKAVEIAIGSKYNFNKERYTDESFKELFNPVSIEQMLATKEINDSIMRGFRGRWGTNEYNMKKGVIQPLARISFMDAMSHTRRIVSDFDTSMKLVGPRHLNPSQIGYFCTAETPTGGHIGATKNMSILTYISIGTPTAGITQWLLTRGRVIQTANAHRDLVANGTSVQINGGTIGFTERPDLLKYVLQLLKWTACISPMTSISFNTSEKILRIYMDDGRPLRPLWKLRQGRWPRIMETIYGGAASSGLHKALPSWRDLVCGTYPGTVGFPVTSHITVDPLGKIEDRLPTLEEYVAELEPFAGDIEYIDPYEGNEAYISWWGTQKDIAPEHTHSEIHPSTMMGLLANMIPFSNHNQSPRNQLSCSQSKQGIGYYATNYESRFDTYGSMLCYGEGPLCRTILYDAVGRGEMPYGQNIIFCINSFNGYNQDDGILFNRSSIERGLFRSLALRSYTIAEEDDTLAKGMYRIGTPTTVVAWNDVKPGHDFSQLDSNGIIKEGAVIHEKSVLVGRYLRNTETGAISDASLTPTVFTKGRVDKVVVLHQANGMRLVHVRILEERVPELGDKFSSRHGQKGTMGMLLDAQDMPRTASGLVPDVMVNPHCIPSRMTIAQLLEQVYGKFGAMIGAKMNATAFMNDEQSFTAIADALQELGVQREGEEIMYSGITGKMFSSSVFIGPLYFMRIKHLTQDKLNSRSAGRKEIRTHQPTGGRGNEGGMRIGEMERDVLVAHGITEFLQESMMKRSDGSTFWICNGCGTVPIYNESTGLFICFMCDGSMDVRDKFNGETLSTMTIAPPITKSRVTFSRVAMPYAMKLLDQELNTYGNLGFRFLTEKMARQFRNFDELRDAKPLVEEGGEKEGEEVVESAGVEESKEDSEAKPAAPLAAIAEDEAEDEEDEGLPAHNDLPSQPPVPPGVQVIEFDAGSKDYKQFGNFFPVKLMLDGKIWPTVEHYFQAMKFPSNPEYQEMIRLAKTPAAAKKLGKTNTVAHRPDWKTYCDFVMYTAIKEKFGDNHIPLKTKLLGTGTAILRNASKQDNYWGLGRKRLGKNKLGVILMQVRDELRAVMRGIALGASDSKDELVSKEGVAAATAAASAATAAEVAANPASTVVNVTVQPGGPVPAPDSSAASASVPLEPIQPASGPPVLEISENPPLPPSVQAPPPPETGALPPAVGLPAPLPGALPLPEPLPGALPPPEALPAVLPAALPGPPGPLLPPPPAPPGPLLPPPPPAVLPPPPAVIPPSGGFFPGVQPQQEPEYKTVVINSPPAKN
jgi:DNA-directed RNA polymerase II subunit RPB2